MSMRRIEQNRVIIMRHAYHSLLQYTNRHSRRTFLLHVRRKFRFIITVLSKVVKRSSVRRSVDRVLAARRHISNYRIQPCTLLSNQGPRRQPISPQKTHQHNRHRNLISKNRFNRKVHFSTRHPRLHRRFKRVPTYNQTKYVIRRPRNHVRAIINNASNVHIIRNLALPAKNSITHIPDRKRHVL